MASSDLLVNLVRTGACGDQVQFRRTVEALIAEERSKQHHVLAEKLAAQLQTPRTNSPKQGGFHDPQVLNLLHEVTPKKSLGDLLLARNVSISCEELVQEQQRAEL